MGLPCDYTEDWYNAPGIPGRAPQPQRTSDVWAGYKKVESDDDIPKVSPPSKLPAAGGGGTNNYKFGSKK